MYFVSDTNINMLLVQQKQHTRGVYPDTITEENEEGADNNQRNGLPRTKSQIDPEGLPDRDA